MSALILGFVFGFDDKKPYFDINLWLLNFFLMAILSLFFLVIYTSTRKLVARKFDCDEELELWKVRRFGLKKTQVTKGGMPLWLIVPFFVSLLTEGRVFFSATTRSYLSTTSTKRLGREFKEVAEWELARISAAPILISMFIALILNLFGNGALLSQLILINLSFAISNILPLPGLDGFNLFFSGTSPYPITISIPVLNLVFFRFKKEI